MVDNRLSWNKQTLTELLDRISKNNFDNGYFDSLNVDSLESGDTIRGLFEECQVLITTARGVAEDIINSLASDILTNTYGKKGLNKMEIRQDLVHRFRERAVEGLGMDKKDWKSSMTDIAEFLEDNTDSRDDLSRFFSELDKRVNGLEGKSPSEVIEGRIFSQFRKTKREIKSIIESLRDSS